MNSHSFFVQLRESGQPHYYPLRRLHHSTPWMGLNYDKTRTYGIDRVLAVKHGTSRFGVKGHCFTCLICGQKRNLWLEKGKWFVEAYCATSEGRAS